MLQLPNSNAKDFGGADTGRKRSEVVLLNKQQWSHVQGRYELTPREREIAELICQGLRNGKIAKVLQIKPSTVKTHTRNIYRKVHVQSKISMLLRFVTDTRDIANPFSGINPATAMD
ncbi:MAG: response regulator transcription factor [Sedimentisphaerales bacterium]|nr:response regulator transcription factor [Sedimentisphaerales bacterium]